MNKIPAFGRWDERDHVGIKQENAIKAAQDAKISPMPGTLDKEKQTATFWGSGKEPYKTTLTTCTCSAFRGAAPCKHIYRLAMELGIIDLPYKTGTPKGEMLQSQIQWRDAVAVIEKLSKETQEWMVEHLCKAKEFRHEPHLCMDKVAISELRQCKLVDEKDPTDLLLGSMKQSALNDLIDRTGRADRPKRNASKAVLAEWAKNNINGLTEYLPECAAFAYADFFDTAQQQTMVYFGAQWENVIY